MAAFVGKGDLKSYSKIAPLPEPVPVSELPVIMGLPETYFNNIIAVRDNRALSLDEPISDGDEILVFISAMGG
ncbi:MAG: hypothetical protein FWG09_00850 [Synergistaceae bacterium]|nr:hypothetical protein [Synergistaceae bacterium]